MPEARKLYQLKDSLVVAVPPTLRQQLGFTRGQVVWWHLPWKGEAVLTATPERVGGYPDGLTTHDELVAARAEVIRLRRRVQGLEFGLYAQGYAQGRIDGYELAHHPTGRRAGVLGRRRRAQDAGWIEPGAPPPGLVTPAPAPVEPRDPLTDAPVPAPLDGGRAEGVSDRE